jgi:uncharacterized protein YbjT (DUF2867 family)
MPWKSELLVMAHSETSSSFQPSGDNDLYCKDLPSTPRPTKGKVLVTGASGYIGGRLVPELVARGYDVRVMVRAPSPSDKERWPGTEIVTADALNLDQLRIAMREVDTAYYLIHSLLLGQKEFATADIQAAIHFRLAAKENRIRRIIYLGGLGDTQTKLSPHLKSRIQVAEELKKGEIPVTILRAAIIIGSGSASYEIIQSLVRKLPLIFIPRWATTRCQPIAIRDVIKYLIGVLEVSETSGKSFDIGGEEILSYYEMLKIRADLLNKRRFFLPFFSFLPLYTYLGALITPVPAPITQSLMKGLKNEVICLNKDIGRYLPFEPLTYKEAIIRAMNREEQDQIYSRWSDAYPPAHELAMKLHELEGGPLFSRSYSLNTPKDSACLFQCLCRVGGKEGWFSSNWLWWLRGTIDKVFLGVGTSRGRRSQKNRRLLLRAEMKMPGKAWLEFQIQEEGRQRRLSVNAYFHTRTTWGRLYWYFFLPLHRFIFNRLIKQIEIRSIPPFPGKEGQN